MSTFVCLLASILLGLFFWNNFPDLMIISSLSLTLIMTWTLLFIFGMKLVVELLGFSRGTCFIMHGVSINKPVEFNLLSDLHSWHSKLICQVIGCREETQTFIKPFWPIPPWTWESCSITNLLHCFSVTSAEECQRKVTNWRRYDPRNHCFVEVTEEKPLKLQEG